MALFSKNRPLPRKFREIFLRVAAFDQIAEQFLQPFEHSAALMFEHDHLFEAVTVPEQEFQVVHVGFGEAVAQEVNLLGIFQVIIRLAPEQVEKAPAQKGFLRVRHRDVDGGIFAVNGETAVAGLHLANILQVERVGGALDRVPVQRAVQLDKVNRIRFRGTNCAPVGRVNTHAVIHRHAGRKIRVGRNHIFDKRVVVER